MRRCINDETKFYSGYEPSPRGLGYSADKFEPGHKQLGKDGNMWYVSWGQRWSKKELNDVYKFKMKNHQVFMCINGKNTWKEVDFNKLPDDFYTYAYFPICEKIIGPETGLEEKFGGSYPYLTKATPPKIDKHCNPYVFLCQFKDPRELLENTLTNHSASEDVTLFSGAQAKENTMYQLFVSKDFLDYDIRKFNLDKEAVANTYRFEVKSELESYQISGWSKRKELISFEKLAKKLKLPYEMWEILSDNYFDHELCPSRDIKVGGTPTSTQVYDYKGMDLLQLTQCDFLDFQWEHLGGIAHMSTKLDLEWDYH
jgi:hypothetical protein